MDFNNMIGQLITSQIQKSTQSSSGGALGGLGNLGAIAGMLGGGSSSGGALGGLGNLGAIAGMLGGGASSGGGAADILGKVIGGLGGSNDGAGLGGAAKLGGLAMIGGLAYKAYNAYKSSQASAPQGLYEAPKDEDTAMKDGLLIIRAMIGAAAADGTIDREEYNKIFAKAQDGGLSDEERQFMQKELESPCNARDLALQVDDIRQASQVYAAAAMTSKIDSQSERAFMDDLQQYMNIEKGLAQQIEQEVAQMA